MSRWRSIFHTYARMHIERAYITFWLGLVDEVSSNLVSRNCICVRNRRHYWWGGAGILVMGILGNSLRRLRNDRVAILISCLLSRSFLRDCMMCSCVKHRYSSLFFIAITRNRHTSSRTGRIDAGVQLTRTMEPLGHPTPRRPYNDISCYIVFLPKVTGISKYF